VYALSIFQLVLGEYGAAVGLPVILDEGDVGEDTDAAATGFDAVQRCAFSPLSILFSKSISAGESSSQLCERFRPVTCC